MTVRLALERPEDAPAVEALIDRAFGPGRYAKVSERVREFSALHPELSVTAWVGEKMVGAMRQTLVQVGGRPVVFLGPIAVEASQRSGGVGGLMVQHGLEAAKAHGLTSVLLVGDMPFFGQFGFTVAPGVRLPGPVDPRRVLAIGESIAGEVGPL